ncbi:MAG TPA: CDP-alcohol phosphatidyltransferase family protein [Candidatus Limnocylindrales bacterium]|nr:CDP-alcohol phosphatidyltransferase family protein [Candidatus Limnocylindrales bacterium]
MSVEQIPLEMAYGKEVEYAKGANRPKEGAAAGFRNALRIQESLTAGLERKALLWLAERMPARVNSDHLTLVGFAAMFLASGSYAMARWNHAGLLLATLCLALNWFGDSLDGTLARVRNRQRPRYGFYVDHMIDSIGALLLMGGLAASGYLDERIAMGMLAAFLLLSIETYLATYTMGTFRMSFWKFGPTEIRILLAVGNLALWLRPDARVPGLGYRLLDFGGLVAIAGMGGMLAIAAACHTVTLYREETRP